MTHEEYVKKRDEILNTVEQLIQNSKLEEADEKMREVETLDNTWDEVAKATANMRALSESRRQEYTCNSIDFGNGSLLINDSDQIQKQEKLDNSSKEYLNVWARKMMGLSLEKEEKEVFKIVNEVYTHTTGNTGVVIPDTVAKGIWGHVEELYPFWADVSKTYVRGNYTVIKENESTEAKWYDESTITEDGKEIFGTVDLTGCELARSVTISWKIKEMAIEDFIPYIQNKLAVKIGAGLGYGATHGKGKPSSSETFKPEPLGAVTALEKEIDTPQIKTYAPGSLSYKDIVGARSLVSSCFANQLNIYVNAKTKWNDLANIVDGNGRSIFIADITNGGVYKILGCTIKEDDSMRDGEILFANASQGYISNINKNITLSEEDHIKARTTDYCAYAIVDGSIIDTRAFALLKKE